MFLVGALIDPESEREKREGGTERGREAGREGGRQGEKRKGREGRDGG